MRKTCPIGHATPGVLARMAGSILIKFLTTSPLPQCRTLTARFGQVVASLPVDEESAAVVVINERSLPVVERVRIPWTVPGAGTAPNHGAVRVANTAGCDATAALIPLPPSRPERTICFASCR